jgi:hypothetical protein
LGKRFIRKFEKFLYQGISPSQLALTIALGIVIGAFPVYGTTTILCALVAIIFRLNMAVIQLANYASYPVMLITMIPLYKLGAIMFKAGTFSMSLIEITDMFKFDPFRALRMVGDSVLYAITAWGLIAPFAIVILYGIFLPITRRISLSRGT